MRVVQAWLWTTPNPRLSRRLISQVSFMLSAFLRGLALPRPDVFLIEAQPIFTSLAGVALAGLKRRPYVLNISDLWPDHLLSVGLLSEQHIVYRVARRVVDATYHHAGAIAAMSPQWARKIAGYLGSEDKIRVIYNGVDLEHFRPGLDTDAWRARHGLGDYQWIGFIGTFTTPYAFDLMLAAAERLQNRPEVRFLFIGGGTQEGLLREALATGRYPNIVWLDWIPKEEVPLAWNAMRLCYWALADHDLYRGTIPARLYEVTACGVPIAAIVEGIAAEIIQANDLGQALNYNDVDGLVNAITRLLDDGAFHAHCSQAARRYAEAHYDYHQVVERYEALLQQAAPPPTETAR
ncbi:MAG: glycosyltransferase family 4 protein [Anaerolineae bacterium]|nr:glycosyltransferase family 4 protein [Anaerolineae bacterium]